MVWKLLYASKKKTNNIIHSHYIPINLYLNFNLLSFIYFYFSFLNFTLFFPSINSCTTNNILSRLLLTFTSTIFICICIYTFGCLNQFTLTKTSNFKGLFKSIGKFLYLRLLINISISTYVYLFCNIIYHIILFCWVIEISFDSVAILFSIIII